MNLSTLSTTCPPSTEYVRPPTPPLGGGWVDRSDTWTENNPRTRWQIDAELKAYRAIRARILRSPRCPVCNQPMTCGQSPTHLSCRPTRKDTP